MRSWKRILVKSWRTFASVFVLPFMFVGMILKELITRSSWPDMECQGMNDKKCSLFTDPDCSKCSFYEPKEAYSKVVCLGIVVCFLAFIQYSFPYLPNFSGG